MRTRDLLSAAVGGLWRQKARTTLTLLGVTVGTTALAFSLALGVGLRTFVENEFTAHREFWRVNVHPLNWGRGDLKEEDIPPDRIAVPADLPADRRDRLRKRLIDDYRSSHRPARVTLVTREHIDRLKRTPDVEDVTAYRVQYAQLTLGEKRGGGSVYAGRVDDFEPSLESHLLFGRGPNPAAGDEAVVSEYTLYNLGLKSDEQMRAVVGQKLRVVLGIGDFAKAGSVAALLAPGAAQEEMSRTQAEILDKIARQLPQQIDKFDLSEFEKTMVKAVTAARAKPKQGAPLRWSDPEYSAVAEVTVVGVTRLPEVRKFDPTDLLGGRAMPASDVLLTPAGEHKLFAQVPEFAALGYPDVGVKVRPGGDLEGVVRAVEEAGLECYSGLKFYKSVKREVTLISAGLNLFALISLLVAAIGITNTLFTSVLERTKEIGIWKSVGARDGHILALFLLEGSAIGLAGGLAGLLAAWGLSIPSNGWVIRLIEHQRGEGKLLSDTVFAWPGWLPVAVVLFAAALTTLAAVYPARRAARVQPVEALRHE
jgi:putative ABC transport system permease protein